MFILGFENLSAQKYSLKHCFVFGIVVMVFISTLCIVTVWFWLNVSVFHPTHLFHKYYTFQNYLANIFLTILLKKVKKQYYTCYGHNINNPLGNNI